MFGLNAGGIQKYILADNKRPPNAHATFFPAGIVHKLFRLLTGFLLLASVMTMGKSYIGDPINCDIGENVKIAVPLFENYCWMGGLYTETDFKEEKYSKDQVHFSPAMSQGLIPRKRDKDGEGLETSRPILRHDYYQWTCFILFAMALMTYTPYMAWKHVEKGTTFKYVCIARLIYARKPFSPEDSDESLEPDEIEKRQAKRARLFARHFLRNRGRFGHLVNGYLATLLFGLVVVIACVAYLDYVFNNKFWMYGFSVIGLYTYHTPAGNPVAFPTTLVFPRMAKCQMHAGAITGKLNTMHGTCLLNTNILNEKLFLVAWVAFFALLILIVLNMIFQLAFIINPMLRRKFLASDAGIDRATAFKVTTSCSYSDWFLLRAVAQFAERHEMTALLRAVDKEMEIAFGMANISSASTCTPASLLMYTSGADFGNNKSALSNSKSAIIEVDDEGDDDNRQGDVKSASIQQHFMQQAQLVNLARKRNSVRETNNNNLNKNNQNNRNNGGGLKETISYF